MSDIKKLGFGLMRLPKKSENVTDVDIEQLKSMVDLFLERGFKYFDTSYVYHDGASETAIREALVKRHPRDSFMLATKFPTFLMPTEDRVEDIFNEQLEKCGVEYFDYYLLHNLNRYLYPNEVKLAHLFDYMKKWKEQGKIRHIVFSYHDDAAHLDEILTEHPEVDAVQIVLNYYDWEEPLIQSEKCYDVIRKHGKQVIVMEPAKGGTLAHVPSGAEHILKELDPTASAASFAIRFAASREGVLVVLSGMSNIAQVDDNTSYMRDFKPLTEAEERALKEVKAEYQKTWKYRCDNWAALDDNAYGVPISTVIRAYNSILIQPTSYCAELYYYKSFRSAYDRAFEMGDYSAQTAKIGGAFDVTAALKEAVKMQLENSFQDHMD